MNSYSHENPVSLASISQAVSSASNTAVVSGGGVAAPVTTIAQGGEVGFRPVQTQQQGQGERSNTHQDPNDADDELFQSTKF